MTYLRRNAQIGLRPLLLSDAPAVAAAVEESRAELMPWLGWCRYDYGLADAEEFTDRAVRLREEDQLYAFGLFRLVDDEFLGCVSLLFISRDHQMASCGYWLRTSARGQGYMPQGVRWVAGMAFTELRFNRVEILVAAENVASQRVAEKAGAQREGLLRRRLLVRETCQDAVLYSLVASDLFP